MNTYHINFTLEQGDKIKNILMKMVMWLLETS